MNQHYVPKVYLKNFADKKGKDYYINVFDKLENKFFKTNIKNICSETDLYTLDKDNLVAKHSLVIEKIYSDFIEPLYYKAYALLTDDNVLKITNQQRVEILIGVFQLYFRNPIVFRKKLDDHIKIVQLLYNQAKMSRKKGVSYLDEDFSFAEWNLEQIENFITNKLVKLFKEKHISGTVEIGSFHEYSILEIQKIDGEGCFLTNDNPLFFEDMLSETDNPLLKSNEFNIPISKKYSLRIYHDKTKQHNYIYRYTTGNVNAFFVNDEIYNRSSRFVIGGEDDFKSYKILKERFDDTSLEPKIKLLENILSNEKLTEGDPESKKVLEYYYNKYLANNTLTDLDEFEMINKIKELNRDAKRNKINK